MSWTPQEIHAQLRAHEDYRRICLPRERYQTRRRLQLWRHRAYVFGAARFPSTFAGRSRIRPSDPPLLRMMNGRNPR